MTLHIPRSLRSIVLMTAAGALAACSSDLTGANKQMVQFSFTSNATATAAASRSIPASFDISVGSSGLVIQSVQMVIDKIELDQTGTANCVAEIESTGDDHASIGSDCEDVARDPVLIDVPVDQTLHATLNVPLAAGTYSQLEAKLEPAPAAATTFNSLNSALVGKSVVVKGMYNGAAFTFTSSVRTSLEMSFNPPLVVDATTKNTSISVDVSKWFIDSSGAVIDPNTATPGSAKLLAVEDNIRRSFHAFEDDAESGVDDHRGHTG